MNCSRDFDLFKISVWNIPGEMLVETLKEKFSRFGSIVDIHMINDQSSTPACELAPKLSCLEFPPRISALIQFSEYESTLRAIKCGYIDDIRITESKEEHLNYVPNLDEDFYLDRINDDCLLHLYSYLNFEDHINLAKISKKQHSVLKYHYKYDKTFDIRRVNLNHSTLSVNTINKFFKENGESIENLILLMSKTHPVQLQIIHLASKYCPNVKTLKVNESLPKTGFELIFKKFISLKTLHLSSWHESSININDCLTLNRSIETFVLSPKWDYNECFLKAFPNLKYLNIWENTISKETINQFPKYLPNLETLRICLSDDTTIKQFVLAVKDMPILKNLEVLLDRCPPLTLEGSLNLLCENHLVDILEILEINECYVSRYINDRHRHREFVNLEIDERYINRYINSHCLKIKEFVNLKELVIRVNNNFFFSDQFWTSLVVLLTCNLRKLSIIFKKSYTKKLFNYESFDWETGDSQINGNEYLRLKLISILDDNNLNILLTLVFGKEHKIILIENGEISSFKVETKSELHQVK